MKAKQTTLGGFSREHFAFFRELARLEPAVLRLNPYFETAGKTNGNFSRTNRDIRFWPDRSPYHTNYYLYFYDRRRDRPSDGRLYVGVSGEGLTLGFSIYAQSKTGTLVRVFRPRLETRQQRLERWLARHVVRHGYDCYWYRSERKQRVKTSGLPRSGAEWLRLDGWVVRKVFKPSHPGMGSASLARQIEQTFQRLFPLYAFTSLEVPGWEKHLRS